MTAIANVYTVYNRHWRIWIPRTVALHCNLILPFSVSTLLKKKRLLVTDKELMMEIIYREKFFFLTDLERRVLTSYLLK
jgi:hypothetical protein